MNDNGMLNEERQYSMDKNWAKALDSNLIADSQFAQEFLKLILQTINKYGQKLLSI